ncbi:PepSY-associated TM helix domain-containing protein [Luteimonas notoginsengisoli]|uniref:PepSY-associated TM helix domain-containing protein n=1 Tax=Luteimonas notoginsengisoli TaxID=1578200 RepID=A0ABV7UR47_9GAMM
MKLKSATLRTFSAVHTWTGLVAGFALFVAFYAGAITVFHHDLPAWQSRAVAEQPRQSLDEAQQLLDGVLQRHPEARVHVGMLFPGSEWPQSSAYWQDAKGTWLFATLDDLDGSPKPPQAGLPELLNELHYSLGLPVAGTWLMGIVSLLYGLALLSGVVIHLPKLANNLFALRPGRNLKQFWQDAHNIVGVLSLPMHVMFAITGALLCLLFVLMAALNPLVYGGKLMQAVPAAMDTAPVREATGIETSAGSLAMWRTRSIEVARAQGIHDFEPSYLKLANAGDRNAVVEVTGESSRALGALGSVALDASTGEVLATQLPGRRDANHATLAATYALHFGEYGNALVPWLYFLLGVGGAFLFYSGNLLWIESRRKRRQQAQGRAQVNMARATVGVCIGFCVAVSAAFVAAQAFEALAPARVDAGMRWTCFLAWAACAAWAAVRPPARAAREVLWLAAATTAAIPLAHGLASGLWPWTSAAAGHWGPFWVDAVALAMSLAFASLARASVRRARQGEPNSVWADPSSSFPHSPQ